MAQAVGSFLSAGGPSLKVRRSQVSFGVMCSWYVLTHLLVGTHSCGDAIRSLKSCCVNKLIRKTKYNPRNITGVWCQHYSPSFLRVPGPAPPVAQQAPSSKCRRCCRWMPRLDSAR